MVTLDRVRSMEIEADYKSGERMPKRGMIHTAVLAYLDLKQENFYQIREKQEGSCFVTARGWEDLSRILQVYEELEIPVTKELAEEYIRDGEIAAGLCRVLSALQEIRKRMGTGQIIFSGKPGKSNRKGKTFRRGRAG